MNHGVAIIRRHLTNIPEVFSIVNDHDIQTVINCSGIGFSDPDVFPTGDSWVLIYALIEQTN